MAAPPLDNPLRIPVLRVLRARPRGLSEYDLIRTIEAGAGFPSLAEEPQLALFQKHFLVMNALYGLRDSLWAEEQLVLEISPLLIVLSARDGFPVSTAGAVAPADASLRDYYLDWSQLTGTSAGDVAAMLDHFWRQYSSAATGSCRRFDALAVLGLSADADWDSIRRRYRELAGRHHPDRGGDTASFLAVREAYEMLRADAGLR